MKKSLLLSAAALTLFCNLEARNWNFSKLSNETLTNLAADALWTEDEKGSGTNYTGCYWFKATSVAEATDENGNLKANGSAIKELEGLKVTAYGSGGAAIGYNYQITADGSKWGPYHGAQYLWFAGTFHIQIPQIAAGTTIKAGIESHKPGDNRGLDMYVAGAKVAWTSGQANYPDAYDEYTWVVPGEDGELVDVEFYQNKGCHVYMIETDEKDGGSVADDELRVAYLYDATYNGAKDASKNPIGWLANGGLENDPIYNVLQSFRVEAIDCSGTPAFTSAELNDSLLNYDVVVLGEAIGSGNAYAKGLFDIVNKVPVLNFKSFMYKKGVWGVGAGVNPSPKATAVKIAPDFFEDPLFADLTIGEDSTIALFDVEDVTTLAGGNLVQAYSNNAGGLFENDDVLATVAGSLAIHTHGNKNRYMLIPLSSDNMDKATDNVQLLVYNAIGILAKTKSAVQKTAKPVVQETASNLVTNVAIVCGTTGSSIMYSVDGSEFKAYTEAFDVTKDSTLVQAYATAHGFDPSDTTSVYVRVYQKLSAPIISVAYEDGYSVITIDTVPGERSNIYYAFTNENTKARTSVYTEPITVKDAGTIYAFAEWATAISSDVVSYDFGVSGAPAVKDTVAHFLPSVVNWVDSCQIYWADTLVGNWDAAVTAGIAAIKSKAYYHFGTSAKSNLVFDHNETVLDSLGNVIKSLVDPTQDSTVAVNVVDPKVNGKVVSLSNSGWEVLSSGQVMTIENAAPEHYIGNGAAARCADAAIDMITGGPQCKGLMDYGGKASGCSYNLRVQTAQKVAAPFYVEIYLGNGSTNNNCAIALQLSADGENWTTIQDMELSVTQRYWKRSKTHFSEAGEYYIRLAQLGNTSKAQLYDIIVMTTEGATGIENVNANDNLNANDNRIFDMQGRRINSMVRGQLYIQNGKKVIFK